MNQQRGAGLLKGFLSENGIGREDAAKALGVSRVTLWSWLAEDSSPSEVSRENIETWTDGAVPSGAWGPLLDRRKDRKKVRAFLAKRAS
jgi:DNA-binding XRE family transcriptional regulator